ncbi:hypothetical protein SI859A1_00997 [Aurantimonas manganoxydans SI85-9A1]|uniref:Uncharacterized protein n=1 Tax=Aurantimonas manganoxydans (strain ATCC BAA-1229 / DSM 21871 / SI85-9A1) TaxID=287752 RepID=Q1YJK2_AURMS|nr:hypothetical protein SI859A1_00997 [Aurantimonas manganoxydans SI85-9A1]
MRRAGRSLVCEVIGFDACAGSVEGWFPRCHAAGAKRECDGPTQTGGPYRSRPRDCRAARSSPPGCVGPSGQAEPAKATGDVSGKARRRPTTREPGDLPSTCDVYGTGCSFRTCVSIRRPSCRGVSGKRRFSRTIRVRSNRTRELSSCLSAIVSPSRRCCP